MLSQSVEGADEYFLAQHQNQARDVLSRNVRFSIRRAHIHVTYLFPRIYKQTGSWTRRLTPYPLRA